MDWARDLLSAFIGAMVALLIKGFAYGFSIRRELDSLKQSQQEFRSAQDAQGVKLAALESKFDNLSNTVSRIEGLLQGKFGQGSSS